jgi:hypothetical protein
MDSYGIDSLHGRELLLLDLADAWQWTEPRRAPFVLFTAADASRTDDRQIEEFARASVAAGCRYVCSWGPDCQRVHDAFDRVLAKPDQALPRSSFMTTWHEDDTLADAIVYAIFDSHFDPEDGGPYFGGSAVIFAVEQPYRSDVCALLDDPEKLDRLFRDE